MMEAWVNINLSEYGQVKYFIFYLRIKGRKDGNESKDTVLS